MSLDCEYRPKHFTNYNASMSSVSESAATLEAESGYSMEEPQVKRFREYIVSGMWSKAEDALLRLGIVNEDNLWVRGISFALGSFY